MLAYYTGGVEGQVVSQMPGVLPGPYYWWEAGAMMGSLIEYHYYTGDTSFNSLVTEAMLFQTGPDANYMPPNQTQSLGNDDQCFWALSAMSAAETRFPNPGPEEPQWLALAQAVFNTQAHRWDMSSCGGGLKWQIFAFNLGYDYKNAISNGCFFNLAARLGAYTHNDTYLEWANRVWDWEQAVGLIGENYMVYDGTGDLENCTSLSHIQWTYNAGIHILGAAMMWRETTGSQQALWQTRLSALLESAKVFFTGDSPTMYEAACEPPGNCNVDQLSFKAYFSRWLGATAKIAPFTHDIILPLLQSSAQAAALSCTGGIQGTLCGMRWTAGTWDGTDGVGQQMCALEVIQTNLLDSVPARVSDGNGGISQGNPAAGGDTNDNLVQLRPITTADRAGAGILTAVAVILTVGGGGWLLS